MSSVVRRGLPRVAGGAPWPPLDDDVVGVDAAPSRGVRAGHAAADVASTASRAEGPQDGGPSRAGTTPPALPEVAAMATEPTIAEAANPGVRRGLPRVAGGEPWPPASARPLAATPGESPGAATTAAHEPAPTPRSTAAAPPASAAPAASVPTRPPLRGRRTVFPTVSSERWSALRAERLGRERPTEVEAPRRTGLLLVGAVGLGIAAGMLVLLTRWLLSTPAGAAFLAAYPGEYPLPAAAPVGLPPWLGWQHFLNVFFLVLIVRSGLQVRHQKRPTAFWSSRRDPRHKISLTLWLHQALDVLWITNGVVFLVLLFATGQWMRIVPTSWDAIPNALSAAAQYVSLDWPTENGWLNYNALQQLAYFTIVFVAAPLAIVTGVRMSGVWPREAPRLNRAYPVEWARAVHYPVMLFFVAFTVVHVGLVLATGARRNLGHMYAAQDGDGWLGVALFAASIAVIAAGWLAARPLVIAPIARLFGNVGTR
ncbi:cytochrome b/b6 domain-containing protein [Microbacterium sp. RURRCA19A]|uniref:cytochrome b/b6 domain-containing protein n=1 Tax=Microbacterium sp. RURRCA19A TaxID=1907391 RepID=UPI000954BC3E|nr:cytochrome b/b6 domain-containing protein [Microbacterium sp. RURRCA19A]SIS11561.1 cytochrome b561 [Microbacterium sp. RURRCA19A]